MQSLREKLAILVEKPPPRALEAVAQYRVVRLTEQPVEQWAVLGENADYIVLPRTYCSCPHFMIRVVGEASTTPCYHLVAVEKARATRRFIDLSLYIRRETLLDIVFEIIYTGRSKTLRRLLYRLQRA